MTTTSGRRPGRCACGVALRLLAHERKREREAHLLCYGQKRCARCRQVKAASAFFRYRTRGGLLFSRCKACEAERKRTRYNESALVRTRRLEEARRSYVRHKLKRMERRAAYYAAHREECHRAQRAYYSANRVALAARQRARYWQQKNLRRIA